MLLKIQGHFSPTPRILHKTHPYTKPGEVLLSVTPAEVRRPLRRINPPKKCWSGQPSPDEYYGSALIRVSEMSWQTFSMSPSPRQRVPNCLKIRTSSPIIPVPKSSHSGQVVI
ncbi:hypothetical protein NFI96_022236 [Prochilodus magdalenae]|nr:hypothetical protein NFI96_022236 [Prochilodus magdalenae]